MSEKPTLENVLEVVSKHFGVSVADLKSKSRDREYVVARSAYFYIAIKKLKVTTIASARYVNRDHATAIHAVKMYDLYGSTMWNAFPEGTDDLWDRYLDNSPDKKIKELEGVYLAVTALGVSRETLTDLSNRINDKIAELKAQQALVYGEIPKMPPTKVIQNKSNYSEPYEKR